MFDIEMKRHAGRAHIRLEGSISGELDSDQLLTALHFVPEDESLLLDLSTISEVDGRAASTLHDALQRRSVQADTVIISPGVRVSMPLVLHNVDRVSSIVRTTEQARAVLGLCTVEIH